MMQHPNAEKIKLIFEEVAQWASRQADIAAVALVGSWARGAARVDSDIDLMILTDSLMLFRQDEKWVNEIRWADMNAEIAAWEGCVSPDEEKK
jgi:predicted nucleotidyltransferase